MSEYETLAHTHEYKIDSRHQTQNILPDSEKSLLLSVIFIPRRIDKTENTDKVFGMQVDFYAY